MAEPDHIIVKPLPNLATAELPAAFHFFYITPKEHENIIRKYFPEEKGPVTNIDPIGNSPVMIKKVRRSFYQSISIYSFLLRHLFHCVFLQISH